MWGQPGLQTDFEANLGYVTKVCQSQSNHPPAKNKQDQSITKGNMLHYYIYITFSNDKILERKKILVDSVAEDGFKTHAYSIGSIRIITVVVVIITHVQKKID